MVPPPALVNVCVAVLSLLIVIKLPAEPETCQVVTVVVVPLVNSSEWATVPSSLKSANVLLPTMVLEAVLAPRENHILLKVFPPPEKVFAVLLVSVIFMVEVLPFTVRLVAVAVVQTVPVPDNVQVPDPMVITRVLALLEENAGVDTFLLLASRVPWVRVKVLVVERAS